MTFIRTEAKEGVLVLTLNRPERLNAAPPAMFDDLRAAIDDIGEARAVLIQGAGKGFCSGADLSGAIDPEASDATPGAAAHRVLTQSYNPAMLAIANLSVPVVSAVRGPAAGIGCSLALAADFCVASDTAYFLHAFASVGLVPDGGASWMLPRLIGKARAAQMMMLADRIPAAEALNWGMVHEVVLDDSLEEAAFALAKRLAEGPTVALGLIRRSLQSAFTSDYPTALANEAVNQQCARDSRDAQEGMDAFRQKRRPEFRGA